VKIKAIPDLKRKIVKLIYIVQGFKCASRIHEITVLTRTSGSKPEIVVPGSGIRFQYFIFKISGKPSFVEAVL
jgi:hypothetical protein